METRLDNLFALLGSTYRLRQAGFALTEMPLFSFSPPLANAVIFRLCPYMFTEGSSKAARKAAAQQIGEVQKGHPYDLQNLLERCHFYLHHSHWDTRIAASQAIEAIVSHVPIWQSQKRADDDGKKDATKNGSSSMNVDAKPDVKQMARFTFATFDVTAVLENGKVLLASEGLEFEKAGALSPAELARQRQQIIEDLKLKVNDNQDNPDFLNDEDLQADAESSAKSSADVAVKDEAKSEALQASFTSARMRNQLKRKQREAADRPQVNINVSGLSAESRKTKTVMTDQPQTEDKLVVEAVMDVDRAFEDLNEWPLERFCDELLVELFDKKWEVRHGAALGLREILSKHAEGAGKRADSSITQQREEQRAWYCDSAIRLLCVIMLDRFADFSGDTPVAHVREACSQALAVIMAKMEEEDLLAVWKVLQQLVTESQRWEVRHGAFLAIKYLVASRTSFVEKHMPSFIEIFFIGLQDSEADVKGVCADAMHPLLKRNITGSIVAPLNPNEMKSEVKKEIDPSMDVDESNSAPVSGIITTETCTRLYDTLRELLNQLDDVSSATNNLLILLASLCTLIAEHPGLVPTLDAATLIPQLFPFFRHAVRTVRNSVLKMISALLISERSSNTLWLPTVAPTLYQLLFQNFVLEEDEQIVEQSLGSWRLLLLQTSQIETAMLVNVQLEDGSIVQQEKACSLTEAMITSEVLVGWFGVLASPLGNTIDTSVFIQIPFPNQGDQGSEFSSTGVSDRSIVVSQCYENLSLAMAAIASICREFSATLSTIALTMIMGPTGSERIAGAFFIAKWIEALSFPLESDTVPTTLVNGRARQDPFSVGFPAWVWDQLLECTAQWTQQSYFSETNNLMEAMRFDCKKMIKVFNDNGVQFDLGVEPEAMTFDQMQEFTDVTFDTLIPSVRLVVLKNGSLPSQVLQGMRVRAQHAMGHLQETQQILYNTSAALIACAVISMSYGSGFNLDPSLRKLPPQLNDVIKPILAAVDRLSDPVWQQHLATSMACLTFSLTAPKPRMLIINRLKAHLFVTRTAISALAFASEIEMSLFTPDAPKKTKKRKNIGSRMIEDDIEGESGDDDAEANNAMDVIEEKNSGAKSKRSKTTEASSMNLDVGTSASVNTVEQITVAKEIGKRTSELTFVAMAKIHGPSLFEDLPTLWDIIENPMSSKEENDVEIPISSLTIMTIAPHVHASLKEKMLSLVQPVVSRLTTSSTTMLRALAAEALASIVRYTAPQSMNMLVTYVIPALQNADNVNARRGAALGIHACIATLELEVLPYLTFLIVPILGRMSDQDDIVRKTMSFSFASLVKLMPLEARAPNPPDMPQHLVEARVKERVFLEQLIGGRKVEAYDMPIKINTELRAYQKEGVSWLAFLNKYHLHGILADDMGLGKTLQTICIVNSDYVFRAQQFAKTKSPEFKPLPTLVVCPTILVPHWEGEVRRFCDPSIKVLQYKGSSSERISLRSKLNSAQILVTSYDVLRIDIDYFTDMQFNYCILDEGHIIRNPKTKITQSVKRVRANHRVILSGTPIQNNVLELWSLFDFLMPGFLGSEKQFMAMYSRPVMQSREEKASIRDQEKGTLALEALHRQVLPFILRRMKEDVLHDLPPKIIQDVNVELAPLQMKLYTEFVKHNAPSDTDDSKHVFQSLQYLRKLASHPKLVVNPHHPKWSEITAELKSEGKTLDDYELSPKLVALKELLLSCGIGQEKTGMDAGITQNRVLIFTQLKQMLDIVENDLFKKAMPFVSYSRLDGDVPMGSRMPLVERFNSNPSIDVLLLTVSVGGLGLNLTGANTVIFLEHDWNPQNDLQAMDRVHRIGQTKTVNVYRLITRGTLEEKIMGLQRFKLQIANTIVNKDNQSFQSMDTSQLLDLFNTSDSEGKSSGNSSEEAVDQLGNVITAKSSKGLKGLLDSIGELGDESRYAEEYDLDALLSKLH